MMKKINVIISWSSGKDAALTLWRLLNNPHYNVVGLYTTYVGEEVPFQATPIEVLKEQARLIGLPLFLIELPQVFPPNEVYQQTVINGLKASGLNIQAVAFGDIFCNGIADYRKQYIEPEGWQCIFPLMGDSSHKLAIEMITIGIKTKLVTVDTSQCEAQYCGKWFNKALLEELPTYIDPCGENGEFHTLVINAPYFHKPLKVEWQRIDKTERFYYQRYQLSDRTVCSD